VHNAIPWHLSRLPLPRLFLFFLTQDRFGTQFQDRADDVLGRLLRHKCCRHTQFLAQRDVAQTVVPQLRERLRSLVSA
jgi:hypothetical protein